MESNIETEIIGLEGEFWRSLQDRDVDAAVRLTNFPCLLTGHQGFSMIDRDSFKEMMKSATYTLDKFEIKEGAKVRQISDNVAVIAYEVHEELTVDGKPVTFDASESSTWINQNGRWTCAAHNEAILGDPFGRDRQQR